MAIKWSTDSKIEYIDPTYNFPISIGASGEMSLRVEDSRKLLIKIVGTEKTITQQMIVQKFRGFLLTHSKTFLANFIRENKINIFAIDEHLSDISKALFAKLFPDFLDYGVVLERFFVTTIVKPEDDRAYQKFKDLHFRQYADVAEAELRQKVGLIDQTTQAQRKIIEAQSMAQKRSLEGYTYKDERGFDVADKVASNEAVGQFSNLGVGLGMVAGVGGAVGATVGGIVNDTMGNVLDSKSIQAQKIKTITCSSCGFSVTSNAKYCPQCGEKVIDLKDDEIQCPSCKASTPKGKFCKECGFSLSSVCPNCGKDISSGSKFCSECGQKL